MREVDEEKIEELARELYLRMAVTAAPNNSPLNEDTVRRHAAYVWDEHLVRRHPYRDAVEAIIEEVMG